MSPTAWRCAVCGATVGVATPHPFRCPRATADDWRHVLHPTTAAPDGAAGVLAELAGHRNPLVRYGPLMAWWAFADANGMPVADRVALAEQVGAGFTVTPLTAHQLPLDAGQPTPTTTVWIKDETGNVGGSHKGRHLVGILLHLRAAELLGIAPYDAARPPLAIASCGNAAIAAATLAQAAEWPLRVFVPEWASPTVLATLGRLGAQVNVCVRRDDDPPGDPSVLRCREAIAAGALPFTVQGPDNALCLDAGRTLGWELADLAGADAGPDRLDRVVVQVGGGALAACVGWGLGPATRLDTVQADGCAPLARAWFRAKDRGLGADSWAQHWTELMTPWELPGSAADGILDDETYDWLGAVEAMHRSWGRPIVAPEEAIIGAHRVAITTGIPVSTTGSAGLAGLLVTEGCPRPDERVAVIFSGVAR